MGDVFDTGLLTPALAERLRLLAGSKHFTDAMEKASDDINTRLFKQIDVTCKGLEWAWLGVVMLLLLETLGVLINFEQALIR